jgi:DNA-binding LytR/AlgR family response regulator
MNVLIVEDEKPTAERLAQLLAELNDNLNVSMVHSLASAQKFFVANPSIDVMLLDIELGDGTGFDLLNNINHSRFHVVFTTAYNEHAIKAFKVNAIDYLLKPIDKAELAKALERCQSQPEEELANLLRKLEKLQTPSYKKRFLVKTGDKMSLVNTEEIAYFYSEDGYTFIKTQQANVIIDYSLDDLEEIMDPSEFFRLNRKFIVHINSIQNIRTYFNGRLSISLNPDFKESVIIPRSKVADFKRFVEH